MTENLLSADVIQISKFEEKDSEGKKAKESEEKDEWNFSEEPKCFRKDAKTRGAYNCRTIR